MNKIILCLSLILCISLQAAQADLQRINALTYEQGIVMAAQQDPDGSLYFAGLDDGERWAEGDFTVTHRLGNSVLIILNTATGERRFYHEGDQGYLFAKNNGQEDGVLALTFCKIKQGLSRKPGKPSGEKSLRRADRVNFGRGVLQSAKNAPCKSYPMNIEINPEQVALAALAALQLEQ